MFLDDGNLCRRGLSAGAVWRLPRHGHTVSSAPGPSHPARDPAPRLSLLHPLTLHLIPMTGLMFCQHLLGLSHPEKPLQGGKQPEPSDVPSSGPSPSTPAPAGIFSEGSAVEPWGQEGVPLPWRHPSVPVHSAGKVHMAQSLGNYSDILGASLLEAPSQLMFPGQAGYQTATHTPSFPTGSWRCQGQGSSPLP